MIKSAISSITFLFLVSISTRYNLSFEEVESPAKEIIEESNDEDSDYYDEDDEFDEEDDELDDFDDFSDLDEEEGADI